MKIILTPQQRRVLARAMTLIELTVVIVVILSLVSILFLGASAWKRGSDRANCTMQIRQVQVAMRSYANLNSLNPGDDVSPVVLKDQIVGPGMFVESSPTCPSGGLYTFAGNTVPTIGSLYMTCSLAVSDRHEPANYDDW